MPYLDAKVTGKNLGKSDAHWMNQRDVPSDRNEFFHFFWIFFFETKDQFVISLYCKLKTEKLIVRISIVRLFILEKNQVFITCCCFTFVV